MKKTLIVSLLVFSVMMLSGCAAALLGGQGNDNYSSSIDGRAGAQVAEDQAISAAVKEGLSADPVTTGSEIHIETTDAIVVLKGDVASVRISRRAAEIAGQVERVRTVRNYLWVRSGG